MGEGERPGPTAGGAAVPLERKIAARRLCSRSGRDGRPREIDGLGETAVRLAVVFHSPFVREWISSFFCISGSDLGRKSRAHTETSRCSKALLSNLDRPVPSLSHGYDAFASFAPPAPAKHAVAFNVRREQYDAVGECLVWTLKTGLGDAWTADVADAWEWAYRTIAATMGDAGEGAREKSNMRPKVSFAEDSTGAVEQRKAAEETRAAAAIAERPLPSLRSLIRAGVTDRNDIALRPSCTALLIVDIQKELSTIDVDSPHIEYAKEAFPRMIKNTSRLLRRMRANRAKMAPGETGSECVFTYCEALTDDSRDVSLDYKLSGPLLANLPCPSRPAQFVPGVEPVRGRDVCLPKTSCSVFQSTNADYVLRNLGVEQIVVCGQPTGESVEGAVRDAADRGYLVTVATDACAAGSAADHERGLHGMRGFSRQLATDDVLRELGMR